MRKSISEFFKYVSFSVMGMVGISCYILADTFFVANGLGAAGLTALNLAIPVYNFINGCGLMLGMGGATRFSIAMAAGDEAKGRRIFTNAIYAVCAAALIFVTMGLLFSQQITGMLGADEVAFQMTNTYLRVLLLFSPAFLLNNILLCFVRNDGNPGLPMLAMLGGSVANIVLDYVFIFPLRMGIFGAVLATGIAPVISISILSLHFLSGKCGFGFRKEKLDSKLIGGFVSTGFSSFVAEVSTGIVMIVFNIIILNLMGNIGVAAYGVIANIALVVLAVFTGIGQGTQPVVSQAYGKGEMKKTHFYLFLGAASAVVTACAVYLAVNLFAEPITSAFNSEGNPVLQSIAEEGLRLYFLYAPFAGFNIVLATFFASVQKNGFAQAISMLRGIVLIIPAVFILSNLYGMTGVWLAFPVVETAVMMCGIGLYLKMGGQTTGRR